MRGPIYWRKRRMHEEREEAEAKCNHKDRYLAMKIQRNRTVIGEVTPADRSGNGFDEGDH